MTFIQFRTTLGFVVLFLLSPQWGFTQSESPNVTESLLASPALEAGRVSASSIGPPTLKWAYGGCFSSWCQTGWYSSPAVADLNGDGRMEVLWGSYDLVAVSGNEGKLLWRAASDNRVWPGVAIADLAGDGSQEIIVARSGGQLTVYNGSGAVVWSATAFADGSEIRTLAVEDLDQDGQLEIIVGKAGSGSTKQLNVFTAQGTVRPGWPARRDGEPGYGWGMYNQNVAVGDLNGDGRKEIIGPTDTHYITALDRDGNQLPVNTMFGSGKVWSQVGVHVEQAVDLRGYANCGTEHRPNFANSPPTIADLNGDGINEIVVVGNVYNCGTDPYTSLYYMPFIFKADRSRWSGSGFDWTSIPTPEPGSSPLSEDYNVIETAQPNPVIADLDGDGKKEILFASYDGKMHAYWLDKTEHGHWPYKIPGEGIRFASEPVIADLDNNGQAEILFTSWPEKVAGRVGQLHILSSNGDPLFEINLPAPRGDSWNGALAAPTLADIDGDGELELVINTTASGVVAYDLPGTGQARVLWNTGRGGFRRTGALSASQSQEVFIPIVLSSAGINGSFFTSELTLTNRGTGKGTLVFTYTSAIGSGSGTATDTIGPGRQRITGNTIDYLRSLGISIPPTGDQGGTLRITSTGMSAPEDLGVSVRTTTTVPQGRAGLSYPGIPVSMALTGPAYICGLRQNSNDRSNVAIQNMGSTSAGPVTLRLTVYSGGNPAGLSQVLPDQTLSPGGFLQISGILSSNGLSYSNGFVRVERVNGTAPFFAYGVINDQSNSDGSFIPPIQENAFAGKVRAALPVAVEVGSFSTELVMTNWTSTKKTLNFRYVSDSILEPDLTANFSVDMNPFTQLIWPDLVQRLRNAQTPGIGAPGAGVAGALFVTVETGDLQGISVSARTSAPGGGGRYGLFYTALSDAQASASETWLYGIQQNLENRTNLALVNTAESGGSSDVFRIELFDGNTGQLAATIDNVSLDPSRWTQFNTILSHYAPGVTQGYARLLRTAGSSPFIAYAVINDGGQAGERSGDGAYIASTP
ncbi:MAG: FG-GAP-like repeat-containing protein [Terriglobia bacterium]